jgi:hypothetical protein
LKKDKIRTKTEDLHIKKDRRLLRKVRIKINKLRIKLNNFIILTLLFVINKLMLITHIPLLFRKKINEIENPECREIITVSLTLFILLSTLMQTFSNNNLNEHGLEEVNYLKIPYLSLQLQASTIIEVFYGLGIAYLVFCYIYILFDPVIKNESREVRQDVLRPKINASLILNLIFSSLAIILLILNSIFPKQLQLLELAIFVIIINVATAMAIGLFGLFSLYSGLFKLNTELNAMYNSLVETLSSSNTQKSTLYELENISILNNKEIECQKEKYDIIRKNNSIHSINHRTLDAEELLQENARELAEEVNKLLVKYDQEIPPDLQKEIKKSIQYCSENLKCDKLYDLYKILSRSDMNNILDDLKKLGS